MHLETAIISSSLLRLRPAALLCLAAMTAQANAQRLPEPVATLTAPVNVEPLEIAAIDRTGRVGPWQDYRAGQGNQHPAASNLVMGAGETRKLRAPGPIFVPTDGAACEGFDPICFAPCSQTRYILTDCNRTYGGIRISGVSSATGNGATGNVHQIFIAWTNKRNPGELDDFNPQRPIGDTVIEILTYDNQFDPNCGPGTGNITGGVLVNFGPLPALCDTEVYYTATLNLLDFPGVCMTIPGPSLPMGYEMRFWYDVNQSAPAANNQAILWGAKEPIIQGQTLQNGYIDNDYDGNYDPNTECTNLNIQRCPAPLAAAVDFWGNTGPGIINLWDNGSYTTGFNNGCAGADTSVIEAPGALFGSETHVSLTRQADDFNVPAGQVWTLDNLVWYLFQPDSATGDPINAAYIRIWNGVPGGGGAVIAGDMTTNRLTTSTFQNAYRVEISNLVDCRRAIKAATIDMTWAPPLPSGSYWIEIGTEGTLGFPGPLSNPIVPRDPENHNSRAFDVANNIWSQNFDNGLAFDFPFELEGTTSDNGCEPMYAMRLGGSCPGLITVEWSGATPDRTQGLAFGNRIGKTRIPQSYPCTGFVLGLAGQVRLVDPPGFFSTGSGAGQLSGKAAPAACGGYLQLVEGGSCRMSNVARIPE